MDVLTYLSRLNVTSIMAVKVVKSADLMKAAGSSPMSGCSFRTVCRVHFFFSSRRRHTRFDCDWSSDVCSSDLLAGDRGPHRRRLAPRPRRAPPERSQQAGAHLPARGRRLPGPEEPAPDEPPDSVEDRKSVV